MGHMVAEGRARGSRECAGFLPRARSVEKKKEEGAKERIRLPSERYFKNLLPRNPGAHGCDGAGQGVVKKPPTAP